MSVRSRRRSGRLSGNGLCLTIPGGAEAAAEARSAVGLVGRDLAPDVRHALRLLISELVTNSVQHGGADRNGLVRVDIATAEETVRVAVTDLGPGFTPPRRPPKPRLDGPWGLLIVDRLAARWGTDHGGRCVWFELERDGLPDTATSPAAGERLAHGPVPPGFVGRVPELGHAALESSGAVRP
jgi:anti-sigma regulatory factor (Ser/Thr protein kinase)